MEGTTYTSYSARLHRDMYCKVFGDSGRICLAFPTGGGHYYDFENFGLVKPLKHLIKNGKLQLVLVDSIDSESILAYDRDPGRRIEIYEAWFEYVLEELYPQIREKSKTRKKSIVLGADVGAYHAANFFFRRPDVFDTLVGLSGIYNASNFFAGYMDDLIHVNSPVHLLESMPADHPWVRKYRKSNIILCSGQGMWEDKPVQNTSELDTVLEKMNIDHWTDYWGLDVSHDWYWWQNQIAYFFDCLKL